MIDREDVLIRYLAAKADMDRAQLDSFIAACKKFVESKE